MKTKLLFLVLIALSIKVSAQEISTNRNPVGLEHNLLFNAQNRFNVTQTGGGQLNLNQIFDGKFAPSYSATAPSNLQILIENLPAVHIQAGAWVGWSTRYWPSNHFKIEGYNTYGGANSWVTFANYQTTPYSGVDFLVRCNPGAYSKLRFTFYSATGTSGRLGVSELYFIHPEATAPYAGLLTTNGGAISAKSNNPVSSVNGFQNKIQIVDASHGAIVYNPGQSNELMFGFHSNGNFYWGTGGATATPSNYYAMLLDGSTGDLGIKGKLTSDEVEVKVGGWADYVFDDNYKLKPIEEVEQFININNHLPDVPSEKEVMENGLNLGESDAVLLQKIEELTLYLIEQNKRIKEQEQEIRDLKKDISKLQESIK